MRTNVKIKQSFVLLLLTSSLFSAISVNAAVITNHSGTICKNYNNTEVGFVDYWQYGTRSLKTTAQYIICPLTRNTSASNGSLVDVDISHTANASTTCTAYSYSFTGTLLASQTLTWTGTGFHEFNFNLVGAGKSTSWSDYSVLCNIPGNGVGIIRGIDLSEQ